MGKLQRRLMHLYYLLNAYYVPDTGVDKSRYTVVNTKTELIKVL